MNQLRFALVVLLREIRAGELTTLLGAVVIAVASISAVGLFTDRLERAMGRQAAELLGADLLIRTSSPSAPAREALAASLQLETAKTATFRSVVVNGDEFQLVEAKAVTDGYPLRGTMRIADVPFGEARATDSVPAPGQAWVDARLSAALGVSVNDTVVLGESTLKVGAIVAYEPDRAGDFFSIAPRLLFNYDDLARTNLIQPGSRVGYRLLVGGSAEGVSAFRDVLDAEPIEGEQIQTLSDARPEMRVAQERARQFLGLSALAAVLLAGVSIALSARRYARRHLDTAGLMRCFGASRNQVMRAFSLQLVMVGLGAGAIGVAVGYGAQAVLVQLLSALFISGLPDPRAASALLGLAFGLVTLLGFGLPPLLKLSRVSPARVLRKDDGGFSARNSLAYLAAIATAGGLVLWFASDVRLALYVLGASAAACLALGVAAWILVRSLQALRGSVGVAWRFGFANIARRGGASTVQVVSFGLGLLVLLLLAIVRTDLIEAWAQNLPASTPNYFLINVQPGQADAVRENLEQQGVREAATYPMIRGRFVTKNGDAIEPTQFEEGRSRRLATREFNLSFVTDLPKGNKIVEGAWWPNDEAAHWSVEVGLARTLGLSIGDELTFSVAGQKVTGKISSLRAVKWESFDVNFFVVGPPALLRELPATYISSFYLPPKNRTALTELVKQFPSITIIDVDALLTKIRLLIDQATRGVEFVFLFTLLAGLSVLAATVQATLDERRYESALIRTLGGSRARVWQGLGAEFLTLGVLAGVLAATGASLTGWLLAREVFELPYIGNPWIWLIGVPAGALGIGLTGIFGTRKVVSHPPVTTLRAGT